jgi:hypothetical protein
VRLPYLLLIPSYPYMRSSATLMTIQQALNKMAENPYQGIAYVAWATGQSHSATGFLDKMLTLDCKGKHLWPYCMFCEAIDPTTGLDIDGSSGLLSYWYVQFTEALKVARTLNAPGIMIDFEQYTKPELHDMTDVIEDSGLSEAVCISLLRGIGSHMMDLVQEHYPDCIIWPYFNKLVDGPWHYFPSFDTYVGLGFLDRAVELGSGAKWVIGLGEWVGEFNRNMTEVESAINAAVAAHQTYLSQYPNNLRLSFEFAPYNGVSNTTGIVNTWLNSDLPSVEFTNVSLMAPMLSMMLDNVSYVWVWADSYCGYDPSNPTTSLPFNEMVTGVLDDI